MLELLQFQLEVYLGHLLKETHLCLPETGVPRLQPQGIHSMPLRIAQILVLLPEQNQEQVVLSYQITCQY